MTLQASGAISIQNLVGEFGGVAPVSLSSYYKGGARVPVSAPNAGVPTSGQISLSQFYSTQSVTGGGFVFSAPGTYSFTVPNYTTFSYVAKAGGGGAGGSMLADSGGSAGGAGGSTSLSGAGISINVTGGTGGQVARWQNPPPGGNYSVTGADGASGSPTGSGGAGGTSTAKQHNFQYSTTFGSGENAQEFNYSATGTIKGGNGGTGGYSAGTATPTVGQIITIIVGNGGASGDATTATNGDNGSVTITIS